MLSLRRVGVPVARVFVAMDGDNKRSWMTQRETIVSLDIGSEDPVLNRDKPAIPAKCFKQPLAEGSRHQPGVQVIRQMDTTTNKIAPFWEKNYLYSRDLRNSIPSHCSVVCCNRHSLAAR